MKYTEHRLGSIKEKTLNTRLKMGKTQGEWLSRRTRKKSKSKKG